MADDFDYDLDPADLILNEQRRSHARTLSALDDNPDDAARAEQISRVSGQNPALVHSDLEAKEKQLKADLTTHLLNNNQYLRSYIDAHPLANKVSNDDYGQMDATSEAMGKLPGYRKFAYNITTGIEHSIGLTAEGLGYLFGAKGFEGAGERYHKKTLSDVSANKGEEKQFEESEKSISGMVGQGVGGLVPLLAGSVITGGGLPAVGIMMGLQGGAEAKNRAAAMGVDEQTQATAFTAGFAINTILGVAPFHLLLRPAQAVAPGVTAWTTAKLLDAMKFAPTFAGFGELQHGFNEYAARLLYDPNAAYHPDFNRIVSSLILGGFMAAGFNRVAPYVNANKEIPPGAHPLVDHAKAKQAEIDIDNLDNALKEASKSATRERSPELFKIFMRQHTNAKIGVSAEAILKIYGEKEPVFDDGKLGWVPNIKEQLAVARETGGDVEIPLADWLAHVDPKLAKELHDDVRVRTNGLTVREGTTLQERTAPVKAPEPEPTGPNADFVKKAREIQAVEKVWGWNAKTVAESIGKNVGPEAEAAFRTEYDRLMKEAIAEREARRKGTALEGAPMVEAYHASPHEFDAFSMEKIGTGEGSQSFGHGLYVAENPKVSGPGGEYHKRFESEHGKANTYRVRIHAEKDQFLDWDIPFAKQTPHVQQAIRHLIENSLSRQQSAREQAVARGGFGTGRPFTAKQLEEYSQPLPKADELTGEQAYQRLGLPAKDRQEGAQKASKLLSELGIPGIRYLDQGSRQIRPRETVLKEIEHVEAQIERMNTPEGAEAFEKLNPGTDVIKGRSRFEDELKNLKGELASENPTYNYVIFDEKLIEIVDRNGEAIQAVRQQAGLEPLARRFWTDEKLDQAATALEGKIEEHAPGLKAVVPEGELSPAEVKAVEAANTVLDQILSKAVTKVPARLISYEESGVQGFFQQYTDRIPTIMYLMDPRTAVNTVRHEAIHFLRREGFFTKSEWDVLREAALKDGWIEHYDIARRYGKEDIATQLEEAVAHRYADWAEGDKHGKPEVNTIMDRIRGLTLKIIAEMKKALPHDMTVEELFQKIESGEIGRREGTKPLDKRAFKGAAQEMEPGAEQAQRDLFAKANAIGMTVPQFERYMRQIKKLGEEDQAAQMKRAEAFERKKQTAEWKADEARIRDEVTNDIQFRPDIAAATFFTEGKLYDTIKNQSPKLDFNAVDPELAKRLPKELLSKTGGINPDDIAPFFGYQTGKEMVSKLVEMNEAKGEMKFREFVKGIVDDEVGQRMLREHGMLEENILKAAQDHVVGDTQMEILHEEFIGLGMKSKSLENPFTKDQIKAWAADQFSRLPLENIKMEKFLSEAGKAGKEAEMKLLIGKVDEAFQQKQRQYIAMLMAREAKQLEREQDQFDKTAKRFSARKIENVEQSYTDYVQALLSLAGLRVRRSDGEIAESIQAFGTGSLEKFVEMKSNQGWDLAVSDNVQQRNIKPIEEMSVAEFREFKEAIDSLVHVGREEKKIIVGEERRYFDEVKQEIIDNIIQLPERDKKHPTRLLYSLDASLVKMEEIAKDLDLRKQAGPMFKALILPLMKAKRTEYDMLAKLSEELAEIKGFAKPWKKTLSDTIPNDFLIDPRGNVPFDLSRENMINIMLNFGNRSNIQKFTEGYAGKKGAGTLEARLWQMFDQHATKEDWQFVQKIWDLFETWRGESDSMYRRISGVPPKWIEVEPLTTRHGEFKGGYFPIIYDKLRSNAAVIEDKAVPATSTFGSDYFKATTGAGYAKARTGYIDYVQFENSIEQVAGRMQQMIHDISHREAVMSVGKIIYDRQIRAEMREHYGPEYEQQLHPWLRDIANHYNANEQAIGFWNNIMRRARFNLVAHALGLNLRVIGSPNLGMFNPIQAAKFYSDYTFNREQAYSKSSEIPHTLRSLDRDFREKLEATITNKGWSGIQADAFRWSMLPALHLEQQARMIGFTTRYNRAIKKGLGEADAIAEADNAIRSFHGAAGTIDLPAVMRGSEAMKVMTVFYGFFNTMYNWQRQIPGNVRRQEFGEAWKNLYGAVLIPAAFGALLFNQQKESDSWFKTIGKALVIQPLSTIPVVRDASNYFLEGFPPRSPIATIMNAAGSILSDVKKWKEGKRVDKPITHGANIIGLGLGLPMGQIGRTAQFAKDVQTGHQRPKNIQEWARGIISGEAKLKP